MRGTPATIEARPARRLEGATGPVPSSLLHSCVERMAMTPTSGATLVVSYNGLLEPLGRSQVLAYVVGLADRGHAMRILSFEKHGPRSPLWGPTLHALQERDVLWKPLPHHRWPKVLSTAFDVLAGAALALGEVRRGVGLLHARSHVPALIAGLGRTSGAGLPGA